MIRTLFTFAILLLASSPMFAQNFLSWQMNDRYFSLQVGSGTSTYYGDLKHDQHIRREFSNLNLGVEARLLSKVSARIQGTYYNIKGSDTKAKDSTYAQQRNLSFSSKNWDLNINGVFYLNDYKGDYFRRLQIEPYLFAGLGITHFNPQAEIGEEWVDLADYETEGTDYSQIALVIPAGMGLKFKINTFMNFNLEASYRYAFTDYMDDVSDRYRSAYPDLTHEIISNRKDEIPVVNQNAYDNILIPGGKRGNPKNNDSYLFLNFQLEFYLPPDLFSGEAPLFKKSDAGK
ncbi:MAG: DUF6089 family protein [Cyclobacteriaceae bacterium]